MVKVSIRALTLIEVVISIAIFSVIVTVAYSAFIFLGRTYHQQSADVEIRQGARVGMNNISQQLRMGQYIFEGQTVTIQGITCSVPAAGSSGDSIVFVSPEAGNKGNISYTVRAFFLKKRLKTDPANPDAMQLVMYEKKSVLPLIPDTPSSIKLSTLSGGTFRNLADYISPGGFTVTLSSPPRTVRFYIRVERRDLSNLPVEKEELYTQITLRNF